MLFTSKMAKDNPTGYTGTFFIFKQRQNVLIIKEGKEEQKSELVLLFRRFRFGARDQLEQNSELVPKVEEIENHNAENNY